MTEYFSVKDGNKELHFIRACTGIFYDITNCSILTDGHIDGNDGLVPDAIPVSDYYVADLVAKSKAKANRRASRIRKLQREEALN